MIGLAYTQPSVVVTVGFIVCIAAFHGVQIYAAPNRKGSFIRHGKGISRNFNRAVSRDCVCAGDLRTAVHISLDINRAIGIVLIYIPNGDFVSYLQLLRIDIFAVFIYKPNILKRNIRL